MKIHVHTQSLNFSIPEIVEKLCNNDKETGTLSNVDEYETALKMQHELGACNTYKIIYCAVTTVKFFSRILLTSEAEVF